MTVQIQGS